MKYGDFIIGPASHTTPNVTNTFMITDSTYKYLVLTYHYKQTEQITIKMLASNQWTCIVSNEIKGMVYQVSSPSDIYFRFFLSFTLDWKKSG